METVHTRFASLPRSPPPCLPPTPHPTPPFQQIPSALFVIDFRYIKQKEWRARRFVWFKGECNRLCSGCNRVRLATTTVEIMRSLIPTFQLSSKRHNGSGKGGGGGPKAAGSAGRYTMYKLPPHYQPQPPARGPTRLELL